MGNFNHSRRKQLEGFYGQRATAISVVAAVLASLAIGFQNCAPQNVQQNQSASSGVPTEEGDPSARLAPGYTGQYGSTVSCNASVSSTNVGIGDGFGYTVKTSTTLAAGFRVYVFGAKNGVSDSSEVTEEYLTTLGTPAGAPLVNPGYLGGNYIRYFQVRDIAGRTLCQTNTVSLTLAGASCTLSISTLRPMVGQAYRLDVTYGPGTAVPSGAYLRWYGTDNGVNVAAVVDSTSNTSWIPVATSGDRGVDKVRRLVVHNADNSIYCQTNNIRFKVE